MSDAIITERDGAVAAVVLNRPDELNALDLSEWQPIGDVMRDLDAFVRRVVPDAARLDAAHTLAHAIDERRAVFDTEDYRIGSAAFLANRKPELEGR